MFISIEALDAIFKKYDDGKIASAIDCNRKLLSELVATAACDNYWISKSAMYILQNGMDIIYSHNNQDISYLELLNNSDWILLFNGAYSKAFTYTNIQYINGWPANLLDLTNQYSDEIFFEYLTINIYNKEAILEAYKLFPIQISLLIPRLNIDIWQYLVLTISGTLLAIKFIKSYSITDQKQLLKYLELNSPLTKNQIIKKIKIELDGKY